MYVHINSLNAKLLNRVVDSDWLLWKLQTNMEVEHRRRQLQSEIGLSSPHGRTILI